MKRLLYILPIILISCNFSSSKDNSKNEGITEQKKITRNSQFEPHICKQANNNLNISILLDLSDRISYQGQMQRDIGYIKSIADIFLDHIKKKKAMNLEDRIQLFFEPNPNSIKTNEIAKKLKYSVNRHASREVLKKVTEAYNNLPMQLYEKAHEDVTTQNGADIWGFFKNKVKSYCIEGCHRNILIILTDGYLYYEDGNRRNQSKTTYINSKLLSRSDLNTPKWQKTIEKQQLGIIKSIENLENLEVLVLGIDKRNHKNPHAEDIIKHLWAKWFQEMGIAHYNIVNTDLPINIEKVIRDFIVKF